MSDAFKGKRVLITGGAGFIGSNLTEAFLNLGAYVRVLDNFSQGKHENLSDVVDHPHLEIMAGDITDLETCKTACTNIDYVLHHAALGSVPRSIKDPLLFHQMNVNGTFNMLLAARDQGVKRFVYASSSSVYGDSAELPKKEGMEGCLLSPYAVTKATNELNAQNFYTTYGLPTIGLRYFNVFGKRQDPNSQYAAVMPLFVKALLDKKSPTIFGDGKQSRDFTHVDNVIEANIRSCLAGEQAFGKAFNIGCSAQHYLIDVYNILCEMMGISLPPQYTSPRDGDIMHSHACIELAKQYLGYVPQTQLKEGLEKSIAWYKANL